MNKEIWRDIEGYEGEYQVSNFGRVKSLKRKYVPNEHFLKPDVSKRGYEQVHLRRKGKVFKIHRLVAQAFIPNQHNKPQVNHIDGNKRNNCVDNLEWCDNDKNRSHAIQNGLLKIGVEDPQSKFTKVDLQKIKEEYIRNSRTHGMPALAKKYNVSVTAIYFVIHNKHYKRD